MKMNKIQAVIRKSMFNKKQRFNRLVILLPLLLYKLL